MKVLITGIGGSGASYLAEHLINNGYVSRLAGFSRWHSTSSHVNLSFVRDHVDVFEVDLTDLSSIMRGLDASAPDVIFHFASHANVRAGFDTPLAVLQNNIMGTANLLEALRLMRSSAVLQMCSTSEVYGQVYTHEVPIKESNPLRPASPYAVSKVTQDLLSQSYFESFGLNVVRTRMFAYLNPRRSDLFATAFAEQVVEIERGNREVLRHGNLRSTRTIVDVRDAMEAYWLAATKGLPGEVYNLGGSSVIEVGDFLEMLKARSSVPIKTEEDESLLRPTDVTLQIPDISKFVDLTGWQPIYTLDESIAFLLSEVRAKRPGR